MRGSDKSATVLFQCVYIMRASFGDLAPGLFEADKLKHNCMHFIQYINEYSHTQLPLSNIFE